MKDETIKITNRTKRSRNSGRRDFGLAAILVFFCILQAGLASTSSTLQTTDAHRCHDTIAEKENGSYRQTRSTDPGLTLDTMPSEKRRFASLHRLQSRLQSKTRLTTASVLTRGGATVQKRKTAAPFNAENKKIQKAKNNDSKDGNPTAPSSQPPPEYKGLKVLYASAFFTCLSMSLVSFAPAPALIAEIGSERATSTLSMLAACAALTEIIISPVFGSLLDSIGRKPAFVVISSVMALMHGAVGIRPSVLTICAAKYVGGLCIATSFTASQVMVSDISASNPERMSSMLGMQYAFIGFAFFVGSIGAGWLSEFGISATYFASTIVSIFTALLVSVGLRETLLPSKVIPLKDNKTRLRKQLLQSPLSSCTRILTRHSREVRILAILMMFQSLPSQMRDTFQIILKTEWDINTKDFSSFIAMIGIMNIFANIVGSKMVLKLGIKHFTAIATFSSILSPIAASLLSFRGLILGTIIGFLGPVQTLGVTAALYAEGAKSNVPQGELAGERSSFLALTKVIGPIWYSALYVKGKKIFGTGYLPFLFNIGCGMIAFGISQRYLPA